MNELLSTRDWQALHEKLVAPFDADDVDFRPQGKANGNSGEVQVVCYVDARAVMNRLDEVCGPDGWTFTWEPVVVERGQVMIAKGRLTVHGVVREDVGEASNFDPSKGCVSDTLKRCAVHFGVGRYLYDIERTWVKASGNGDRLSNETIAQLRARLRAKQERAKQERGQERVQRPAATAPAATAPAATAPAPGMPDAQMRERLAKFHATLVISDEQMARDRAMTAEELRDRFSALERLYKVAAHNGTLRSAEEYDLKMAELGYKPS